MGLALGASGCTAGLPGRPLDEESSPSTPSTSPGEDPSGASGTPRPDPDRTLWEGLVRRQRSLIALVAAVAAEANGAQRSRLRTLRRLLAEHDGVLAGALADAPSPEPGPTVPRNRDRAMRMVTTEVEAWRDHLDRGVRRARSGQLARLLAAMAAAHAQLAAEEGA